MTTKCYLHFSFQTEFRCTVCDEEWPYDEVRKLAKLTVDEQSEFEKQLGMNTIETFLDFRDVSTFLPCRSRITKS